MAWYHVGSCDCPMGSCFCVEPIKSEPPTDEELDRDNAHVWYAYNPTYPYCELRLVGTPERRKPSFHKTWKFMYLGKL